MTILQKLQARIDLVIESKKESNSKVVLESLECLYDESFTKAFDSKYKIQSLIKEKSVVIPKGDQPWAASTKNADAVGDLYDKIQAKAVHSSTKFLRMMKVATRRLNDPKILVDIKKKDAFVDKVVNRGKAANKITDLLRAAILLDDEAAVNAAVSQIKKDFVVAEYEKKAKGGDKEYGYYGSHHFLVEIDAMLCEIQVMTKKLWAYKKQAHKIYGKWRSDKDANNAAKQLDLQLSRDIFNRGNQK